MRAWLISLALISPARADDAVEPVVDLEVGGYVETYYALNLRLPSNRITNLRGFDNRDRTFTLQNVALDVKARRGPVSTRVIAQIGATPSTYYLAEPTQPGTASVNASDGSLWKYLQQATVTYADGVVVEIGLTPSPIGPEVFAIKDNWTWSRSNLFVGLPFYHTGAKASYPLGGGWTGTAHLYSGWNSVIDNNAYPSIGLSASYASARVSAQVLYFGGIERATGAPEGKAWRNLLDAYANVAVSDEVSVIAHADGGIEPNELGTSGWLAGQLAAKVQLSDELHAAARADYFREWIASDGAMSASAIFWPAEWIASLTGTLAYQPVAGLSVRLEFRHDHADTAVFFDGDVTGDGVMTPYVPNGRAQDTVTLGATAWF